MIRYMLLVVALMFGGLTAQAADKVDINRADAQTIASQLTGIGPVKAEAIVKHREEKGPFRSADELAEVSGIGEKTVEENRDRLSFSTDADSQ